MTLTTFNLIIYFGLVFAVLAIIGFKFELIKLSIKSNITSKEKLDLHKLIQKKDEDLLHYSELMKNAGKRLRDKEAYIENLKKQNEALHKEKNRVAEKSGKQSFYLKTFVSKVEGHGFKSKKGALEHCAAWKNLKKGL